MFDNQFAAIIKAYRETNISDDRIQSTGSLILSNLNILNNCASPDPNYCPQRSIKIEKPRGTDQCVLPSADFRKDASFNSPNIPIKTVNQIIKDDRFDKSPDNLTKDRLGAFLCKVKPQRALKRSGDIQKISS